MFVRVLTFAVCLMLTVGSARAAEEYGTPAEAKAMLERVVTAIKANKAKALEEITKGEDGFKEKDLYAYCGGPDGNFTAHPKLVGKSLKDLMDKGTPPKPVGADVYKTAQEGKISEVSYMWPRPNDPEQKPVEKVLYVTKVSDQVCGVGYYK
ncbi:cache domain-containing protein [Defluviicoccus vanus]|uniref:Cache domain-containing protein n=1 Tax=Defluviicoccus vanus TaxID=111831 RepID=A0A7H1N4V0_9PROT|nr:cache domain-containing protein [Defluviicoccus vanus]QNT70736.1 cache domain-containing protein [Defluviicoccus vanus]